MRELKFRAWVGTDYAEDGNTSIDFKMTPPFTIFDIEEHGVLLFDKPELDYVDLQLHDHVLMQYTGLVDCTGQEIYEGDVLKAVNGDHFVVRWAEGLAGFRAIQSINTEGIGSLGWFFSSIVGNIYENPELVKHD